MRTIRTLLRTTHIVAFAALHGGHVYSLPLERLFPAVAAAVATGAAFAALETYHRPVWLVRLRGVATLVKLLLVAAIALRWNLRVLLLTVAIVIGSVGSHMSGRCRYYSILHGRHGGSRESA